MTETMVNFVCHSVTVCDSRILASVGADRTCSTSIAKKRFHSNHFKNGLVEILSALLYISLG